MGAVEVKIDVAGRRLGAERLQSGGVVDCGGGFVFGALTFPVPGQKLVELRLRDIVDPGENVGEPGLGIDIVHFCRDDERIHGGGALTAAVRSTEEPGLSSQSNHPFILPMLGRSWKSTTDGTLILAVSSRYCEWRIERRANF